MNLQQLEYIVAVDNHRHFARAAESKYITQPTLSMMIQKLEDELGLKIFDRSRQPVEPTKEGVQIIYRARQILNEVERMREYVGEVKGETSGEIRFGVIPTLAPYLLPLFLKAFTNKYPLVKLFITEMITEQIVTGLQSGELDMALLATPLHQAALAEHPLFYEEFFVYATHHENLPRKKYLLPADLNPAHLWLLQEGHCLRNQVFNLCELKGKNNSDENLFYEAGSIETLINLVDKHQGITIVPKLATLALSKQQKKNIREFSKPKPVREISLVVNQNFPRKQLLENLKKEILLHLPNDMTVKSKNVLGI